MMDIMLGLIVLIPFLGALILAIFGAYQSKKLVGTIGCASVGISWILSMIILGNYLSHSMASVVNVEFYRWINVDGLAVSMGFHLDALSIVMISVITFVGFLIHVYAAQSMYEEDGYSRFFAYMNLFDGFMLTLVLADNLLLLYLGWEGVGLCSYLLIGFWYKKTANCYAAQKAFIVTRVGDTALAVGFFLIFTQLHTFNIQQILKLAPSTWAAGGAIVTAVAILVLGGAVGKSAQIPLQTWLPDAMAGPTPVSALIHAATMVTAGVYLIARLNGIFVMAPLAHLIVGIVGAATLFYAGFSALTQNDIKRVLAYSTISQIGYMFLALGVGAWTAAIFHFVTHAFFKALLFLSAGIVIDALNDEHDIFKMGGLKNRLPVAFWTFLIGAASLSALPFITAGFYSKDAILTETWFSGHIILWLIGMLGALITAAYSFRVVFLVFYGEQKSEVIKLPGGLIKFAVIALAFFSITAGFISMPNVLGGFDPFGKLMSSVFHSEIGYVAHFGLSQGSLVLISSLLSIFGVYLALLYFRKPELSEALGKTKAGCLVHKFFYYGWGFDWLYDKLFVRPFKAVAVWNSSDFIDRIYVGLAAIAVCGNRALSYAQTGRLRNYATGMVLGAVILAAILLLR